MKTKFLVCALLLSSCLTTWAWFPPRITQAKINQIQIGQTTEADLVHLFGTPTTRSADLTHYIAVDWFRSVPAPIQSYIPLIGSFLGGQHRGPELTFVLSPGGRVVRYEVHSSRDTLHASRTGTPRVPRSSAGSPSSVATNRRIWPKPGRRPSGPSAAVPPHPSGLPPAARA